MVVIAWCLSPLTLWVRITLWRCVLDTTLCDKAGQWLATGRWFSPASSSNKTDRQDITEILLKVALNTIDQTKPSFVFINPLNHEYLIQHSLKTGGTKYHFRQVKIPGTAPYWKVWCPQVEIEIPSLYKLLGYRKERIKVIYHQLQNFILLSFPSIVQWKPKIWINFCQHQKWDENVFIYKIL